MNSNKFEEAKNKVIFSAERLAERYFLNKFGSAKFSKEPKIELEATEGITSDSYQFTGKIRCYASTPVLEGYSEVGLDLTVNNNDVSVESETTVGDNIVKALNASDEYSPVEDVLTASLDSFQLVDKNNGYLAVSHPALQESTLGVVSQHEYATSPNKSELLQTIVKDAMTRIPSEKVKVAFSGEFKEPTISKWVDVLPEESITKTAEQEFIPSQEIQSDDLPLARMTGGVEKAIQAEQQKVVFEIDKLSNQSTNQLVAYLNMIGYTNPKVQEIDTTNLSNTEKGISGKIDVYAYIQTKNAIKLVAMPITITSGKTELPKLPLLRELIDKAVDVNQKLSEHIAKEALLKLAEVEEHVNYYKDEVAAILSEGAISKTATENGLSGVQLVGPQDVIVLQKHLLPASAEGLEIGDVIFGDNQFYKLVSKDSAQNSKGENDGSLWKFIKCEPTKEEPKVVIPE